MNKTRWIGLMTVLVLLLVGAIVAVRLNSEYIIRQRMQVSLMVTPTPRPW